MKNLIMKTVLITGLCTMIHGHAMADSTEANCYVVGFHEPHTQIYNGPTICPEITLSTLTVRGPLQLNHTIIKGTTTVSGPIKASGAKPQDIIVKESLKPGKVVLQNSTTVYGNIEFQGKEGVVYLEEGSLIKGKVINGKIMKSENDPKGAPHEPS